MASDGGGVPNSKQHARPQKPYDRRTSIVRRMRETMKDMMSPSWLVDLVHSVRKPPRPSQPAQSMNNVSQQAPASRNQTLCSEVRNTHTAFVPINQAVATSSSAPSSRTATFTSDGLRFSQSHTVPLQGVSGQTVYSSTAGYTQPTPEYTQESGNYIQPKGDDQSEVSEYSVSTSGCSSLVPHPDQREYQRDILQLSESTIVQMRQDLGGSVTPSKEIDPPTQCHASAADVRNVSKLSISDNNKSFLWSSSTARPSRPSRPQPPAKSQRPAFNVSIFGSPIQNASSRRHELGKEYQQSPYYPGKTTFGGAAAHRKNRLKHSSPYHSPLTKRQVTARPLNNSTLGGVTSSTAKRILDTLEKMSTPIKDAKKIPSYNSSLVDSSLSFTPGNYRRRSLAMHRQGSSTSEPPPVMGLVPPTMAPVMRNLQGPTDRQATPHVPPQYRTRSAAPERGVESAREAATDGGARTGKMKRERGQHYSSKKVSQDEEVELPALPTSFTLPIGSMPTISFGGNLTPGAASNTPTSTQPSWSGVGANVSSPLFRFSSPILKEGGDDLAGASSPTSIQSFRFSSPIAVDKPVSVVHTTSSHATPFSAAPFNSTSFSTSPSLAFSYQLDSAKLKMKSPPAAVSVPEPSGFSPARELSAGSVMDILSKSADDHTTSNRTGESKASGGTTSDLSSLFKKPAGSWECPMCMIQNKADVNKCVACNTSKPSSTLKDPALTQKAPDCAPGGQSLSSLFKTPAGSWECPTCMIQNKAEVNKCVACETARPKTNNSQATTSSNNEIPAPVGGNSLAAMFKKPSGSWECPTCMVQNGATHDVCPACTTPRPGAPGKSADEPVKVSTPQLPPLTGPSLAAQFAKPAGSWECDTCMVTNKGQSNKCIACETPRPGTKSTTNFTSPGGFKFGSTGGLVLTSATTTTDSTAATPVFSFGTTFPTSKPSETKDKPLDGGFKFGSGSSAPADFGTAGINFGQSSVSASTSTGFKTNDSSSGVLPAKPSDSGAKTVPFGGIQFGQPTTTSVGGSSQFNAEAPAGGFKFGAAASGAAAKISEPAPLTTSSATGSAPSDQTGTTSTSLSSNGVKFGIPESTKASDVTTTTTAPLFSGFSATTTNSSSGGSQVKQPDAGGFSFGRPTSVAADATNSTTSSAQKGGFQFGASSTAAFTNPASSGAKMGGFSFGGSTKTFDTKSQSGAAAGGFSFGAGAKTAETKTASSSGTVGGFSFGASTKTAEAKTVSTDTAGGFSFGATAKTSAAGTEKAATSSTSSFSPMVMTPGTPGAGGFQFPTTLASTASSSSADQSKSIFGSAATSATSKPQTGGFTFGAAAAPTSVPSGGSATTTAAPSNFAFGGSGSSTVGTDAGFAFRKRANEGDDAPVKRSKGFGDPGGFVFGGASTATSTSASASPFGASAGGFGSTTPVFGASTPNTAAATFNPPAFGAATSAPAAGSMFAAPAAAPPAFGAPQAATTKSTFQFGAPPPTTAGRFSFGGSQPAQSTTTPKPSGGFAFGGQSQPTALGVGAAAPPQSAPSFNFSSTPNLNFGAGQQANPAAPFQFGAPPGGAPGASNSFSINRAPTSGSATNRRVIKRAVRKIKK